MQNRSLAELLLTLQRMADVQAKLQRTSIVKVESGKDLRGAFFPQNTQPQSSNSRPRLIGEIPYDEGKFVELERIAELTEDSGHHIRGVKTELENQGLLVRSKSLVVKKLLPPIKEEKTMTYVKSVVQGFLEEDNLDPSSKQYLEGKSVSPILRAQIDNNRLTNKKEYVIQKADRPKDLMLQGSGIFEKGTSRSRSRVDAGTRQHASIDNSGVRTVRSGRSTSRTLN